MGAGVAAGRAWRRGGAAAGRACRRDGRADQAYHRGASRHDGGTPLRWSGDGLGRPRGESAIRPSRGRL